MIPSPGFRPDSDTILIRFNRYDRKEDGASAPSSCLLSGDLTQTHSLLIRIYTIFIAWARTV